MPPADRVSSRAPAAGAALRGLPSVDALLGALAARAELSAVPRGRLTEAVREVLGRERRRLLETPGATAEDAEALGARAAAALAGGRPVA